MGLMNVPVIDLSYHMNGSYRSWTEKSIRCNKEVSPANSPVEPKSHVLRNWSSACLAVISNGCAIPVKEFYRVASEIRQHNRTRTINDVCIWTAVLAVSLISARNGDFLQCKYLPPQCSEAARLQFKYTTEAYLPPPKVYFSLRGLGARSIKDLSTHCDISNTLSES